jgi:multiple sugar transport system permease protein
MSGRTPRLHLRYQTRLRLLLLPYASGIFVLVVVPAILALGVAFFHYDALSPPRWAGTLNFILAYTDELFNLSVRNSLALILLPVPLRVFGAALVARLMQRGGRFLSWYRAAVFVPSVLPTAAFALVWLWILNPLFGPVNLLLQAVGINPPAWFADPQWAKPALILMAFWQVGEGFLVALAALQDLPVELEDAARVDGATFWQLFTRVILPLIAPILLLLTFRDAILTFQTSFTNVLLTTGGGPYYATYVLPQFIYEQGFDLLSFGTAGVGLWVMYLLSGLIVVGLYIIARQWGIGTTDETYVL